MTPSGVLKSISTGGRSVRSCSKVSFGSTFSRMVMSLPGMGSGLNYYLAAVLAICSASVHGARAGARDHFEDEVLAAGGFVSALGRMSGAFTRRIFLSRVMIVLSSPTDAATRPSSTCPSASRITSGWLLNHGLSVGVQATGMNFFPWQIGQVTFPVPLQTLQVTLVVPPQTLHLPVLTALTP